MVPCCGVRQDHCYVMIRDLRKNQKLLRMELADSYLPGVIKGTRIVVTFMPKG